MPRFRALLTILLAALAVTVTACGESEADRAKSSVEDYLHAVQDGDGGKACGLLTDRAKQAIERSGPRCAQAISSIKNGAASQLASRLKDAKVENVKVKGDTASAEIKLDPITQTVNLVKQDGKWKLEPRAFAG